MVTVDEFPPSSGLCLVGDKLQDEIGQGIDGGVDKGLGVRGRGELNVRSALVLEMSRGWEGEEAVFLHSQQGDPATHVFEGAIGFIPLYGLTDEAGYLGTCSVRIFLDKGANAFQIVRGEMSSAVVHG
jgi:hypothetical protein